MIMEKQLTNQKKASYISMFLLQKQSQFKENMDFEFVQ